MIIIIIIIIITVTFVQGGIARARIHTYIYILHIGQVSALYKINHTDSSGRDYRICSLRASFRLIHDPPWTSFAVLPSKSVQRLQTTFLRSLLLR
jgi:hypothetical protein